MSHYTVGVILKKSEIQKLTNELKTEINETHKEAEFKAIQILTDEALSPYYENARTLIEDLTKEKVIDEFNSILNYTKEEKENDEDKKRLYETYEGTNVEYFAKDYYDYELEEDGLYTNYNPNGKWDWYVIGGRWANTLPKRDKKTNYETDSYNDDMNSYAQIKDLKFKKIITLKQKEEYRKKYDKLISKGEFFKPEYYLKKYPTFESYLKDKSIFSTYALLDSNNQWHEPGRMGWFGCSAASPEDESSFNEVFLSLIEKEDEENYFVLVDCHI